METVLILRGDNDELKGRECSRKGKTRLQLAETMRSYVNSELRGDNVDLR